MSRAAAAPRPATLPQTAVTPPFDGYLARLGFHTAPPPTLAGLRLLQRRHMERVPFENLDVIGGRPIVLGGNAAVDKVVRRGRGGFCFELNEAFRGLLVHLGFDVERIEGRVWAADRSDFGPAFDHLGLIVRIPEGAFLADVGFGDGPREPMAFPLGDLDDAVAGAFRLRSADGGLVELSRRKPGDPTDAFAPLYRMTRQPQPIEAFAAMFAFHQSSPDSFFTRGPIVTVATPRGRKTLTADRLIVTEGGERVETPASPADRTRILLDHFAIALE